MRIDENELRRRLNSSRNLVNTVVKVVPFRPANCEGKKHLTPDKVEELAVRQAFGQTTRAIAKELNICQPSVVKRTNGFKHEGVQPDTFTRIKDLALMKTMLALNLISEEKLEDLSPKELSQVALNSSRIVGSLESNGVQGAGVNVVIYAPHVREESSFNQIEVSQ